MSIWYVLLFLCIRVSSVGYCYRVERGHVVTLCCVVVRSRICMALFWVMTVGRPRQRRLGLLLKFPLPPAQFSAGPELLMRFSHLIIIRRSGPHTREYDQQNLLRLLHPDHQILLHFRVRVTGSNHIISLRMAVPSPRIMCRGAIFFSAFWMQGIKMCFVVARKNVCTFGYKAFFFFFFQVKQNIIVPCSSQPRKPIFLWALLTHSFTHYITVICTHKMRST